MLTGTSTKSNRTLYYRGYSPLRGRFHYNSDYCSQTIAHLTDYCSPHRLLLTLQTTDCTTTDYRLYHHRLQIVPLQTTDCTTTDYYNYLTLYTGTLQTAIFLPSYAEIKLGGDISLTVGLYMTITNATMEIMTTRLNGLLYFSINENGGIKTTPQPEKPVPFKRRISSFFAK